MPRSFLFIVALSIAPWACAQAESGPWLEMSAPGGTGSERPPPTATHTGGSAGEDTNAGGGGTGLTSSNFGSDDDTESAEPDDCPSKEISSCDWSRLDGCCSQHACERASDADVFNTYPVESCRDLVACVQAHPDCSTPADPLCFQSEAPGAPCLQEGYQASHQDPEGPFAWTAQLVRCVCGY